ncbi:hypothetical protein C8R41DRAFT_261862 [Lentinula lateritia]|uniref:Uncharacterized protein n=1 Tax=Lentinula lateritia TaxID=40482 RepID=A0ABQ8VJI6_9AGAR|nr:hypothetical protein C8R41DRAFT_261862 [Lentinula lateritia]
MLFLRSRIYGSSFEPYFVLILGLVYAAFGCAAMPLSQSGLSTATTSTNISHREVPFKVIFITPQKDLRLYDIPDKSETVNQLQQYLDLMTVELGFRPTVQVGNAQKQPYKHESRKSVSLYLGLNNPQSESAEIRQAWNTAKLAVMQTVHPFAVTSFSILTATATPVELFRIREGRLMPV